jgi:ATP-dependent helicase/nuclease subunit A
MAEYQPTAAQRAAVEDRGGALLVSAAAGSGKTRVLVDRLLGMVCDPVSPKNIDDFLIITYTNAAAAELREKIASELSRRLSEDPGNRHLARQMNRLYLAQISTVHAFCTTILRAWAHTLDLPADFRVAEEQECDVLRQESMERVIEQSYAALDGEPAVRQFIDTLGYGRDDRRVAEIAMQAYRSALCHADPVGWLQACAAQAQRDGEEPLATVWGAALLSQLRSALQRSRRLLAAAAEEGARDPVLAEKYVPTFRHNMELLDELLALDTWDAFFAQTKPDFGRLGTVRAKDASERQEWMKDVRHRCAEDTKKLLGCFYAPAAQVMEDQRSGAATVCGIFTIVEAVHGRLTGGRSGAGICSTSRIWSMKRCAC